MGVSGQGGGVTPGASVVAALGRLRALGAALAEARRRVAEGAEVDLVPLHRAVLEALGPPAAGAIASDSGASLLALLDEATALVAGLELEVEASRERGQALARHRRADASYVALERGR